jgi:hypothetical protein
MIGTVALGLGIWALALLGAWSVAGAVGVAVVLMFFATAGVLGVLAQRDLDDKYVVLRKSRDDE